MKRLLLLAGLALALFFPAPSIANGWVRNPADVLAAQDLWVIWDVTDSLGDPLGVSFTSPIASSTSTEFGIAGIEVVCGSRFTSVIVYPEENFISWGGGSSILAAKVDGERYSLPVEHEIGDNHFVMGERGHQLFHRAIREELPVKIAVPIYQKPDEVFEWDMKGGAAAWKEACL